MRVRIAQTAALCGTPPDAEFGAVIEQEASEPPWNFPEREGTMLTTTAVTRPTGAAG